MSDHDDLTRRLSHLGDQPVADDLRDRHLQAMHAATGADVATTDGRRRFGRLAVVGAALAGFLVGSTGFAMAGALPGPVQGVAHDVLSVVQVDVPDWRNRGECVSAAARAGDEAAKAGCPKGGPPAAIPGIDGAPGQQGAPGREGAPGRQGKAPKADKAPGPNTDADPCTGKPPWAGPKTTEEKAAARATCPDRVDDDAADADDDVATEEQPGG